MELDEIRARLDGTAAHLDRVGAELRRLDPGGRAFGGDGPGQLGALGRALSGEFAGALHARDREAAAASGAIGGLTTALRHSLAGYRDVDARRDDAGRRIGGA
jgi:hypothetical protein